MSTVKGNKQRQSLGSSFKNAFWGIGIGLKNERNMKIHFSIMGLVIVLGVVLGMSWIEWCICPILFGMVIGAELVNCAVEAVVDLVTVERKPLARLAKDTAAGAVLVCAIISIIIGCIIFAPKVLAVISSIQ